MYTLCANHEAVELGEGTTVEAYSDNLDNLKCYALDEAKKQQPDYEFRFRDATEEDIVPWSTDPECFILMEYSRLWDNWSIWAVIELDVADFHVPVHVQ